MTEQENPIYYKKFKLISPAYCSACGRYLPHGSWHIEANGKILCLSCGIPKMQVVYRKLKGLMSPNMHGNAVLGVWLGQPPSV